MSKHRILIVEDEAIIAADLERRLRSCGHDPVGVASSGHDACLQATVLNPDLVLMDIVLHGDMDGIEATRSIREKSDVPVIFLTSHADNTTVRRACDTEPFGYLLKPIDERELRVGIEVAIKRHRAEVEHRQMERWMNSTLNSIGDGMIAVDRAGRVVLMNPCAEGLTGWSQAEALDQSLAEVFCRRHARTDAELPDPAALAMERGTVVRLGQPAVLRPRHGDPVPVDESAAPIREQDGTIHGAVIVFRNASDRVRGEEQLGEQNSALERQLRQRTEELSATVEELEQFTGSVVHDLRQPLQTVQGFAALLAWRIESLGDTEAVNLLAQIEDGTLRMGHLIDAFQRLARSHRQDLKIEPINSDALVADCLARLKPESGPVTPVIEVGALPAVDGDWQLIHQVWMNLLSNALKYSAKVPQPRIWIGSMPSANECIFQVRDNGAGFDMQAAERLFKPFQRLHSAASFPGHGIGLNTAKRIVQRHGGRIWAEASPGRGATFWFSLPKSCAPSPAARIAPAPLPAGPETAPFAFPDEPEPASTGRILIVEDQAIIAADLASRLTKLGHEVVGTVATGEAAVELARRIRPSVILMDIQLKAGMDGVQAAAAIGHDLHIPIVFLTSHSDRATFQRAKQVRPMGYVVKPFQDRELSMAIELALHRAESEKRVAESHRWLNTTLRSIGDGVIATDAQGVIRFMNSAAEALTGWEEKFVLGRDLSSAFLVYDAATRRVISSHVATELKSGRLNVAGRESMLVAFGGVHRPIEERGSTIRDADGRVMGSILIFRDVADRKAGEAEREKMIADLTKALNDVETLQGLIPVCAWCRKVRDDDGYWRLFEDYVRRKTRADITHSICPACSHSLIPEESA